MAATFAHLLGIWSFFMYLLIFFHHLPKGKCFAPTYLWDLLEEWLLSTAQPALHSAVSAGLRLLLQPLHGFVFCPLFSAWNSSHSSGCRQGGHSPRCCLCVGGRRLLIFLPFQASTGWCGSVEQETQWCLWQSAECLWFFKGLFVILTINRCLYRELLWSG